MAGVDINTLTMEQFLALSRENQAPSVVKPEIGGNVNYEINSQFMHQLREDTFSENKDKDAHDHIDEKYIEEASMRQAKQDEWLQTFCHSLEKSQNHHDDIIQGLKTRVTTLAKEAVTKIDKNEDCKAIFTNDGAPLYTPFYYSPEEIEYFSANSGFLDDDEFKNVTSIPDEDLK
ncbi:hypothetical protein Tco_0531172 [Tanacetum coccineum]